MKEFSLEELVVRAQSGGTPNTGQEDLYVGNIPFVTIEDITASKKYLYKTIKNVSNKALTVSSAWLVPKNFILYSMYASVGKVRINKIDCATNQAILALQPNKEKIDLEYLYYKLQALEDSVLKFTSQTTQANLNAKIVKGFILNIHKSVTEQKKIAKILQTIDGQIEKTEAIIAKYKAIKQGLMQDLFTRGIDVSTGKLRPSYQQAPELYKPSPLGMIPKDWNVVRIDQIANITTGGKDTQDRIDNGEYPFFVRSQIVERINSYSYDGVAILTAGDGVGVGKVYHYYNGKFDFHQRVYMIYEFNKDVDPKFVFEYFKTHFLAEVDKYSAKTTVDSVRMEMIAGMLFIKPKHSEQTKISKVLESNEQLLNKEENNLAKLRQVKKGLMADLLSGKVRVQVNEEAMC